MIFIKLGSCLVFLTKPQPRELSRKPQLGELSRKPQPLELSRKPRPRELSRKPQPRELSRIAPARGTLTKTPCGRKSAFTSPVKIHLQNPVRAQICFYKPCKNPSPKPGAGANLLLQAQKKSISKTRCGRKSAFTSLEKNQPPRLVKIQTA